MSSGESGGGMSGDDPNDPNSPTYGGIASSDMMGSFADPGETGENVDAAFTDEFLCSLDGTVIDITEPNTTTNNDKLTEPEFPDK